MYLVAECTTRSAPTPRGRCSRGVANVLSTHVSTPFSRAARTSAGTSAISSMGLVGLSTQSMSAPSSAAEVASVSAMSTVRTVKMPRSCHVCASAMLPW